MKQKIVQRLHEDDFCRHIITKIVHFVDYISIYGHNSQSIWIQSFKFGGGCNIHNRHRDLRIIEQLATYIVYLRWPVKSFHYSLSWETSWKVEESWCFLNLVFDLSINWFYSIITQKNISTIKYLISWNFQSKSPLFLQVCFDKRYFA